MNFSRRKFLGQSAAGVTALAGFPVLVNEKDSNKGIGSKPVNIKKGYTILFQGDSITDAGRDKELEMANVRQSFGSGYALVAASSLLYNFPELNLKIHNRGISGNKVYQLAERWQKDCLDLKPDLLSILIGVNDYWHTRSGNYSGTVQVYENDYRTLLQRTKKELPGIKLIICEPFALPETSAVDKSWVEPMKEYQVVARKMAIEFDAVWIPFQKLFDKALSHAPATYWATDGVHPTMAGAQLMAEAWLKSIK